MTEPLLQEVFALRDRYDEEPSHSDRVARLALQLFDGVSQALGLDGRDRDRLQAAAFLHDIGWSQTPDGRGHHQESARLIRAHPWRELAPADAELVALIARYHRKSVPKPDHADFQALPPDGQRRVMLLGGLLRVADALDRTHTGRVTQVEASLGEKKLELRVTARGPWEEELAMVEVKRDMLELALGRPVACAA